MFFLIECIILLTKVANNREASNTEQTLPIPNLRTHTLHQSSPTSQKHPKNLQAKNPAETPSNSRKWKLQEGKYRAPHAGPRELVRVSFSSRCPGP